MLIAPASNETLGEAEVLLLVLRRGAPLPLERGLLAMVPSRRGQACSGRNIWDLLLCQLDDGAAGWGGLRKLLRMLSASDQRGLQRRPQRRDRAKLDVLDALTSSIARRGRCPLHSVVVVAQVAEGRGIADGLLRHNFIYMYQPLAV